MKTFCKFTAEESAGDKKK